MTCLKPSPERIAAFLLPALPPRSYLGDIAYVLWPFGIEEDAYGARNESHDQ